MTCFVFQGKAAEEEQEFFQISKNIKDHKKKVFQVSISQGVGGSIWWNMKREQQVEKGSFFICFQVLFFEWLIYLYSSELM